MSAADRPNFSGVVPIKQNNGELKEFLQFVWYQLEKVT